MKVKLVKEGARLPYRANPTDAGADLFSPEEVIIPALGTHFIDFGIQIELPMGCAGLIYARSGLGTKNGIVPRNCVGVIDEKYRGNVGMMVKNDSITPFVIKKGDRIAQLVITPVFTPSFEIVGDLDIEGDRMGGFGSTGVGV